VLSSIWLGVGGAELAQGRGAPEPASSTSAGSSEGSASGWKRLGLHGVARRAWSRVTAASGMAGREDASGPGLPRPGIPESPRMAGPGGHAGEYIST
jgi:hypothetical protein